MEVWLWFAVQGVVLRSLSLSKNGIIPLFMSKGLTVRNARKHSGHIIIKADSVTQFRNESNIATCKTELDCELKQFAGAYKFSNNE